MILMNEYFVPLFKFNNYIVLLKDLLIVGHCNITLIKKLKNV